MFNFNNNNKKNNSFTSDNLAKHYDNLKKDLKRASILFPSTEGRDEAENEINEWENSQSFAPKTKQNKKSSDIKPFKFLSLGDSELSPLLEKFSKSKENGESVGKNNRYKGIKLLDITESKEKPVEDILNPTTKNIKKIEIPRKDAGDYETVEKYLEKKDGRIHWDNPLDSFNVTSKYGLRNHPIYNTKKHHDGIDLKALPNTKIKTVEDGTVVEAGWKKGYGKYIEIDHGNGLHSFYGHLNKIDVSVGDKVYRGDNIGLSGNTGASKGAHLHFGVHKDGKTADPNKYLP